MHNSLEQLYENEYQALIDIFNEDIVRKSIVRLNYIYKYTENIWWDYIKGIPNGHVRYLFIAEAPPWSPAGVPQYFLDPKSRPRTLMRALKKAFFRNNDQNSKSILKMFSHSGFLLVDSIPFSMQFTNKRNNKNYRKLVSLCVKSYMINKLNNSGLSFGDTTKIIFGYEANALTVIDVFNGKIEIKGQQYRIHKDLICTSAAHYPTADNIRSILDL